MKIKLPKIGDKVISYGTELIINSVENNKSLPNKLMDIFANTSNIFNDQVKIYGETYYHSFVNDMFKSKIEFIKK